MEKLRIKKKEYDIEGIEKDGNLLKIMFSSETDNIKFAGTMDLLTAGGELEATICGYTTVYKVDGSTVVLSNDGSVYTEPVSEPDPVTPELTEEQKQEQERLAKVTETESRIAAIDAEFKTLDYIGIKIATGRASISDYEPEIARMSELADEKNELETQLTDLQSTKEVE
ncbi:hypothetical protein FYJ75_00300 [Roseburia sp. MUC/MUC-530-WT-4D]|uniref:Uncharacterized protein n=1 Tax=Roseburia porci TaxID=2605790 RepID=A0A6L5YMZ9_9FIRM|nr:hypothetical protein [Roseburia porci]MST73472.1 hypothetical protein [Roseburia porci]